MDAVEREAIQQIVAGKPAGLEPLYDRYAWSVKTWAYHQVRSDELAEDITQKTFVELYRAGTENPLLGECDSVQALLILFASRIVTDNHRYAIRQEEVMAELARQPVILPEQPDEIYEEKETNGKVVEEINRLPPILQETADLRILKGMSPKETSELTGTGIRTVNTRTYRARRILARRLRHHFNRKKQ